MSADPFLMGYCAPSGGSWTCVGTGASFDTDPADLNNGYVADQTAIQWLSGTQTTASVLDLQYLWSVAQPVRIVAIKGTSLLAGTKIVVTGQRQSDPAGTFPYPLGGNSATQRVTANNEGSLDCIVICASGNDPLIGIQVSIYNDVNGAVGYTAGQFVYIGEIDPFQGWSPPSGITAKWQFSYDGIAPLLNSVNNQPRREPSNPPRVLDVSFSMVNFTDAFGDPAFPLNVSYDFLSAQLVRGGNSCIVIPRAFDASTGAIDTFSAHKTATFGIVKKIDKPISLGSNLFEMTMQHRESPSK